MLFVCPYLKAGCLFLWRTFTFGRSWGVKLGQWKGGSKCFLLALISKLVVYFCGEHLLLAGHGV
jgi:hypothetical protein